MSWVHGTFAENNYYPYGGGGEGGGGNISSKPCTNVRSASRKNVTKVPDNFVKTVDFFMMKAGDVTKFHAHLSQSVIV